MGNIYANESSLSRIHPLRPAKDLTEDEVARLVATIKQVLTESIRQGGTTLKDFYSRTENPVILLRELFVYGKQGECCKLRTED